MHYVFKHTNLLQKYAQNKVLSYMCDNMTNNIMHLYDWSFLIFKENSFQNQTVDFFYL